MKKAIVLVAVLLVIAYGVTRLFPNEEKVIKSRLNKLADQISIVESLSPIMMATRASSIGSAFAPTCHFETPVHELSPVMDRQSLTQLAARFFMEVKASAMEFQDMEVSLTSEVTSEVQSRVVVAGLLKGGEPFKEDHQVLVSMKKNEDGRWEIEGVKVVETFSS